MSQGYLGLQVEEVIAITPACDLMAGEHVEEPSRVGRSQGFRKAQEPGGSGQQPMLPQFPVQIPLADSKNLGRIAAVTVAGFDR